MTTGMLRLFLYEPMGNADLHNPYRNLATEEFLVGYAAERGGIAILYLWQNEDCIVFGRNQNPSNECRLDLMREMGVMPVRRKTGGGAVFHDLQNLNFSFIVPENYYDRDASMQIVARALRSLGIDAVVNGRNDIVCGNGKVSGSAYLTKGGVCLHHGTLLIAADTGKMERLLTVDKAKFEGKGVSSVKSRVQNLGAIMSGIRVADCMDAIKDRFLECYAGAENAAFEALLLNEEEMSQIDRLCNEYASEEWIFGHEINQGAQLGNRFEWGSCEVRFCGSSYDIYSDTLYADEFAEVRDSVKSGNSKEMFVDGIKKQMFDDICVLLMRGGAKNGNSV